MKKDIKSFDKWNEVKKETEENNSIIKFQTGHIVFMKMGVNVGYEQDGKGKEYLRPVLVYRKFNKRAFLGIPLTLKCKNDNFHYEFEYKRGRKSFAILSQIKLFDIKRAKYYDGKISKIHFGRLQEKFLRLVTPLQKEGECTKAICKSILPKNQPNVKRVFIIAEAGVNHNGDVSLAKKLIDKASEAGADVVKFQTFKAKNLVSKFAQKAQYQKQTTDENESQLEMIKKLELDFDVHEELIEYCGQKGIMFLSTPFDLDSIELLDGLGLDIFKIPSGEITNLPYLRKIGALSKKVILSTGMANIDEINDALNILIKAGTKKENITILHANTEYPTPFEDVNLNAMQTIAETFGVKVGYSDHTQGIEVPTAAVAMGASVIEKHFTLDKTMEGPDHKASLEPDELKAMVSAIRNIELALGSHTKQPSPSESKNKSIARKSIVAKTTIKKGDILSEENLAVKRPGNGINPMKWDKVLGKEAKKDYEEDELI